MADLSFSREDLIKAGSKGGGVDARNIAKKFTAALLIGGIAVLFGLFVVPLLVTVVWNTINLIIGAVILMLVWVVGVNVWKKLPYLNDAISKIFLGWVVEFDEFLIQERQITQAEEDVEDMVKAKEKIEGKYIELLQKVKKNEEDFEINTQAADIAGRNNDGDKEEDLRLAANRNQNYVQNIKPITDDMKFIIDFSTEIYKVIKRKIKNAKLDLQTDKDVFSGINSGSAAIAAAKKAMVGDVQLNNDAAFAAERIKQKIALSIGQMRTSMAILNDVTKENNYKDKAKLELAKKQLYAINNSTGSDAVPVPQIISTPSLNFAGVEKVNRFKDIL